MPTHQEVIMQQALALAKKGQYSTTPNPMVGCIITKDEKIISQGWHQKAGEPHAEILALREAGTKAQGATAYVTLEPCAHQGKTPPCTEELIKAGIKRVIIGCEDPNPLVSGKGIQQLKNAGIEVKHSSLKAEAKTLNRAFFTRITKNRPFTQLKLAMSLDGKTALNNGKSQWITSEPARQDVHRLRAQSCAILTTSNTILKDNPKMTVRLTEEQKAQINYPQNTNTRQPLRIILDSKHRIPPSAEIFKQPGHTLVITTKPASTNEANVSIHQLKSNNNQIDLPCLMEYLATQEINHLFIECGAKLAGKLIQQNLIDELIIYMAPSLLGDKAQSLIELPELTTLNHKHQLTITDITPIGPDWRITAQF